VSRRLVLISRWRLETSRERLWELLVDPLGWPRWWPHLVGVRRVASGNGDGIGTGYAFRWRSGIGYTVRIVMTTRRADAPRELEGTAHGDLSGIGLWVIEENTPGAGTPHLTAGNVPNEETLECPARGPLLNGGSSFGGPFSGKGRGGPPREWPGENPSPRFWENRGKGLGE